MGQRKISGLYLRGGIWVIDKQVQGKRIRESTCSSDFREAQLIFSKRIEEIRQAKFFGVRPKRLFSDAAARYFEEELASLRPRTQEDYVQRLKTLDQYIGQIPLEEVNMGTLESYKQIRQRDGVSKRTINKGYEMVRVILNLATDAWVDEHGIPWLDRSPKIRLLPQDDMRKPRPIDWEEQERLLNALPDHLRTMLLFKVNTGLRESDVRRLQWKWEVKLQKLNSSLFVIPGRYVKNGEDRIVILNEVARRVIETQRGKHSEYVFTYKGRPLKTKINNTSWKKAKARVGLNKVRIHDMKHTFGNRLRAAGVTFEDRQDLLGHKSGRITTHYSMAQFENLVSAANKACIRNDDNPTTSILRILHDAV